MITFIPEFVTLDPMWLPVIFVAGMALGAIITDTITASRKRDKRSGR